MPSVRQRITGQLCVCVVVASLGVTHAFFAAPSPSTTRRNSAAAAAAAAATAAGPRRTCQSSRVATRLNGVREWRAGQPESIREIGFLPFPVDDVMCPGETKALHLYEARFLSLFENAIKNHGGCVGGAIFVEEGVLVRVGQLCDIVAWEREEVGVSVALRCVGRCEISDVTSVDPYICATVREVRDRGGTDEPDEEGEGNDIVSSDVFSLHRQCVELERKMAIVAGGNIGWESGRTAGEQEQQGGEEASTRRKRNKIYGQSDTSGADGDGELFGDDSVGAVFGTSSPAEGGKGAEADDLTARFQLGGGELDLSQLESGGGGGKSGWGSSGGGDGQVSAGSAAAAEAAGVAGVTAGGGSRQPGGSSAAANIDSFAAEFEDDEDDEEEEEEEMEMEGSGKKGLGDLLWGHETYESDGFDSSLEDQVEAMYDSLKADLSVSLEESRGGADATAFGAPSGESGKSAGKDRPWGVDTETIADVIAAAASAPGEGSPPSDGGSGGGGGEDQLLWGCTSPQEERQQLVSFVSLGCFDPSARLQSLMLLSTGERLRMARDALAERLKVLVAKSALSQLGD